MDNALRGRDLLSLGDLTSTELLGLIDAAEAQKRAWNRGGRSAPLAGKSIALIFQKPSMRTRVSFEVACYRLGAHPVVMSGPDGAFSRGETVYDTTKVLERYCDAIVIRTFAQSMVEEIAEYASVPVINALTDDHHPCQALADLLTIREKLGRLDGVRVAFVGDGCNTVHSLMEAAALAGMHIVVATPPGYEPDADVVETARSIALQNRASVETTNDVRAAVSGADVVYTDVWLSMNVDASEKEVRVKAFSPYRVTDELMGLTETGSIFMHCLPAHRGEEVTPQVIDGFRSVVWDQAANRLCTEQAILVALLTGRLEGAGRWA
jgi:ornithine carbamoyltransferase